MLRKLQNEVRPWATRNFGKRKREAWKPLVGLMEEVGELSHAHLKQVQRVRMDEDHEAKAKDAIGDIVIFLIDYCDLRGWDIQQLVEQTWRKVKQRDYRKLKPKDESDALARKFHEAYERLAPKFGYKTRKASAVSWDDVPIKNKKLMTAVAFEILKQKLQPSNVRWGKAKSRCRVRPTR